jgi:prevent-host-death family protein
VARVDVHEAKAHFSHLLAKVAAGEEIVIADGGRPVARLVPYTLAASRRRFGIDRERFTIAEDFDAPLPNALVDDSER